MTDFKPTQAAIEERELELLLFTISELDSFKQPMLGEAIGNDNGAIINVLIKFAKATSIDDKLWCHDMFLSALAKYFKLEDDAENSLIAEVGYYTRTDVDDDEFVPHDTRY